MEATIDALFEVYLAARAFLERQEKHGGYNWRNAGQRRRRWRIGGYAQLAQAVLKAESELCTSIAKVKEG